MSVIRMIYNVGPVSWYQKLARPLIRLLHSCPELQQIVLQDIAVITQTHPVDLILGLPKRSVLTGTLGVVFDTRERILPILH